jgi:pimeloyl-ACP methyl ester carboxylesterase
VFQYVGQARRGGVGTAERAEHVETGDIRALSRGVEVAARGRARQTIAIFTWAVVLVTLHLLSGLAVSGSDRSTIARMGGSLLAVGASGAAVAAFRRSSHVLQGVLALIVGTAATAAGVAVTAVRMVKLGLSGWDFTGVASLGAGVTLLALGAVVLLSGVRRWHRLVALPAALLVFYYLLAPLTLAVYVTNVPTTLHTGRTPSDVGLPYRNVTMTTADGIELVGWYVPSRNGAGVVVLHGSGSTRSHVLDHLKVLGRHGYGVLAIDARGHGDSGGVAMDLGWYGKLDVGAAVSFMARQPDVDPGRIGLLGLSMGGEEALTAAAGDPRIGAVVSDGASAHSLADAGSLGVDGVLSLPFYWVAFAAAELMTPAPPPMGLEDAIGRIAPRPVLLISATDGVESVLNRKYRAVAPGSTDLWEVPDAAHTRSIWTHPDEWARRVLGFLDGALLG